MSKPESIKIQPWTDFPRQAYSIISDDFVHDKLFVGKVNAKSDKSTVNIKATVSSDKVKTISDEVKFWFTLAEGKSIYSKIKSSNYVKLHYDNGITERWGRKWNFYSTINASKSIDNISLRLGAIHLSESCHSDNRIKVDFLAENKKNVTWYNRTVVTRNNFTFGLLGAYGLTNNVLVKNNFLFGYKLGDQNNTSAFLRLENNGYRKAAHNWSDARTYFDNIKVDVVSSYKDFKYGLEANFSTNDNFFKELLVVSQHYQASNKLTTKVRLSSLCNVSVLFKFPALLFKDIAQTSVGFHVNDFCHDKRSFKYGGQVEFNL